MIRAQGEDVQPIRCPGDDPGRGLQDPAQRLPAAPTRRVQQREWIVVREGDWRAGREMPLQERGEGTEGIRGVDEVLVRVLQGRSARLDDPGHAEVELIAQVIDEKCRAADRDVIAVRRLRVRYPIWPGAV